MSGRPNRVIYFGHADYDRASGTPYFCEEIRNQAVALYKRGWTHGEAFAVLLPDGNMDFDNVMFLHWREGNGRS